MDRAIGRVPGSMVRADDHRFTPKETRYISTIDLRDTFINGPTL